MTKKRLQHELLRDLKQLIDQGRSQAVAAVNSAITVTYWHVGRRINEEVLHGERAKYGKQVIPSLAKELVALYGKSFEARNLRRMMQFAEVFPDFKIVSPLVSQLSWTHFIILMSLRNNDTRLFYAKHAIDSKWSKRELQRQIERKAFERSEIADNMTVSGGEPMMQFEFTAALLRAAKEAGLHTCLDTSGIAPIDNYLKLLNVVDIFLYDIKDTDPERHKKTSGVPLQPILDTLTALDTAGGKTILRCPLIPGGNADDEHLKGIAEIANTLTNIIEITLHPYHPLGKSKSERLGGDYPLSNAEFVEDGAINHWLSVIAVHTDVPVRRN